MQEKIIKELISKKNKVYLVNHSQWGKCIKKVYIDKIGFENEKKILLRLSGERAPKLYDYGYNTVYMEYVEGNLLLDEIIEKPTQYHTVKAFYEFLVWFLSKLELVPCDLNFRNFIIKDNICFGLDFEETKKGDILECLTKAIAYCYLYDLEYQKKREFVSSLLKCASQKADDIYEQATEKVLYLTQRRGLIFDKNQFESFLFGL
ncbi:MAG: RIO1 family regulatory kinase/ATPase [Bacillota bacterium]|nr:RIO1 family regulatory kinase/ATPase [Bacillota bacterium]